MALSSGTRKREATPWAFGGRFGAFVLSVLVLGIPDGLAGQFSVYPVQVELDVTESVGTQTLTVQNQADEALDLTVYVNDYDRNAAGDHSYQPFGEHENSCAGRLEVFPDQLTVPGGGTAEVRVRIQPGAGTCWSVVFVERRTQAPSGLTIAQRIGSKIVATSNIQTREGRVAGMATDTTAEPAALIAFMNEGDGPLVVEGEVEIRDLAGEIVGVVDVDEFTVLPRRQRNVRVSLADASLQPGRYVLVAILDFGGEYLAGGQTLLQVEP